VSGDGSRGPGMTRTAFEMKRALERAPHTCPTCAFVDDGVRNHIDALFYERAVDVATRETIRAARGFCRHHARLVSRHADALGTALILRDVLINDLRDLEHGMYDRPVARPGQFARFFDSKSGGLPPRTPCPLCVVEGDIEVLATDNLLGGLGDADFATAFRASDGLCIPHFRLAFERCQDQDTWRAVLETERVMMERITQELEELARKYDYHSHDKPTGAEAGAWRRALDLTSKEIDE
jgi:hypothetical protein